MSAYDSILQGLDEALAYSEASIEDSVTQQVRIPSVDVAAIRARTGLSQAQFARSIGGAKGTLLNGAWPSSANRTSPGFAGDVGEAAIVNE